MNTSTEQTFLSRNLLVMLVAVAAVIVGILSASYLFKPQLLDPDELNATYLPGGKPVRPFQLIDHNGERFDNDRFKGQWTWVFFGYTHCPDACPTALAVLNAAADGLQKQAPDLPLQVLMVSVDPERDTPQRLAAYVPYFNPGFIGATGDNKELTALTRDLGIIYVIHEPEPGRNGYLVDHSTAILLINPAGKLQAIFGQPHMPQSMIDDLLKIQGHYQS